MKKIGIVTIILLVPAIIAGIIVRGSFIEPSTLSNYRVAMMGPELMSIVEEAMDEYEADTSHILRVKCVSEEKFLFRQTYQEVEVLKTFRGDLKEGEKICVSPCSSNIFEFMNAINMGFVNAMMEGEEYLILLNEGITSEELDMTMYPSADGIMTFFFLCDSVPNVIRSEMDVPYDEVKENEFFADSQEVLDRYEALKAKLLEKYH